MKSIPSLVCMSIFETSKHHSKRLKDLIHDYLIRKKLKLAISFYNGTRDKNVIINLSFHAHSIKLDLNTRDQHRKKSHGLLPGYVHVLIRIKNFFTEID